MDFASPRPFFLRKPVWNATRRRARSALLRRADPETPPKDGSCPLVVRLSAELWNDILSRLPLESQLCVALTSKSISAFLDPSGSLRGSKLLHSIQGRHPDRERGNQSDGTYDTPYWNLLQLLETDRWKCCSCCLKLQRVGKFSPAALLKSPKRRSCKLRFGGLLILCACEVLKRSKNVEQFPRFTQVIKDGGRWEKAPAAFVALYDPLGRRPASLDEPVRIFIRICSLLCTFDYMVFHSLDSGSPTIPPHLVAYLERDPLVVRNPPPENTLDVHQTAVGVRPSDSDTIHELYTKYTLRPCVSTLQEDSRLSQCPGDKEHVFVCCCHASELDPQPGTMRHQRDYEQTLTRAEVERIVTESMTAVLGNELCA